MRLTRRSGFGQSKRNDRKNDKGTQKLHRNLPSLTQNTISPVPIPLICTNYKQPSTGRSKRWAKEQVIFTSKTKTPHTKSKENVFENHMSETQENTCKPTLKRKNTPKKEDIIQKKTQECSGSNLLDYTPSIWPLTLCFTLSRIYFKKITCVLKLKIMD